jgi:ketosteroid isomerase-like protein
MKLKEIRTSLDTQSCHVCCIERGKITRCQQYVDTGKLQSVMGAKAGQCLR